MGHKESDTTEAISPYADNRASQVVLVVKKLPANAGDVRDTVLIPGSGNPLEEGLATHSSIWAWRIPPRSLAGYSP